MSEKIYRVQMNSKGMPNFSTAEEIVRCGECKRHGTSLNDGCVYCTQLMWTMNADDFCSYGEREGER